MEVSTEWYLVLSAVLFAIGAVRSQPAEGPAIAARCQTEDQRFVVSIAASRIDRVVPRVGIIVSTSTDV